MSGPPARGSALRGAPRRPLKDGRRGRDALDRRQIDLREARGSRRGRARAKDQRARADSTRVFQRGEG